MANGLRAAQRDLALHGGIDVVVGVQDFPQHHLDHIIDIGVVETE